MGEALEACKNGGTHVDPSENSEEIQWDGERFIVPESIPFEKQETFKKVEAAALDFCRHNNLGVYYKPLISRIIAYRQEGMFLTIWGDLSEDGREEFLADLHTIQHDLMDSFYHHFVKNRNAPRALPSSAIASPVVTKLANIPAHDLKELTAIGSQLIAQGKVGLVLMCAGASSRFQPYGNKFLHPISLSQKTTILELVFRRLQRNCGANRALHIIITCNDENEDYIREYLKGKAYFGFRSSKFHFVPTYSLAVFDGRGKYCVNGRKAMVKRPAGTAAAAEEMFKENASESIYKYMQKDGVEFLCFSGLENILEEPCDPLMLGMLKSEGRKGAGKCVNSLFLGEPLSRYYLERQSRRVNFLNEQDFIHLEDSNVLSRLPIATNSMAFHMSSLVDIINDYQATLFMAAKYHVNIKDEQVYNPRLFHVEWRKCFSFQKDLRDILACIEKPLLLKVDRLQQYAPIISRENEYSLKAAVSHYEARLEKELQGR